MRDGAKTMQTTMTMVLAVAAGGAFGAVGRYLAVGWVERAVGHGFPYGTLAVNVLGSFVLGVLLEIMALKWSASPEMRAFLVVGVIGSFTTFSTFSLEVVTLMTWGQTAAAAGYVAASVVVCVVGFWLGMTVMRQVLT